jgi:hypothetical protein
VNDHYYHLLSPGRALHFGRPSTSVTGGTCRSRSQPYRGLFTLDTCTREVGDQASSTTAGGRSRQAPLYPTARSASARAKGCHGVHRGARHQ